MQRYYGRACRGKVAPLHLSDPHHALISPFPSTTRAARAGATGPAAPAPAFADVPRAGGSEVTCRPSVLPCAAAARVAAQRPLLERTARARRACGCQDHRRRCAYLVRCLTDQRLVNDGSDAQLSLHRSADFGGCRTTGRRKIRGEFRWASRSIEAAGRSSAHPPRTAGGRSGTSCTDVRPHHSNDILTTLDTEQKEEEDDST
ncbi:hypothetical protein MRX96_012500 [Rhipicephalus microplus]